MILSKDFLKQISLITLIIQNSLHSLVLRYSRVHVSGDGKPYLDSVAVLCSELVKFTVCTCVIFIQTGSIRRGKTYLLSHVFGDNNGTLKLLIPASLYTLQNNLIYFALKNLDAPIFLTFSQLKIFTTAVFSVMFLRRRLSVYQWIAVIMLMIGVALLQMSRLNGSDGGATTSSIETTAAGTNDEYEVKNAFMGFVAVVTCSITSGIAGVYFEKVLKSPSSHKLSIWIRNIQLGLWSILLSIFIVFLNDGEKISTGTGAGLFQGFTGYTWIAISFMSVGGLIVAAVVKYTDSIVKGFVASISLVVNVILSSVFLEFTLNSSFAYSSGIVFMSSYIYFSYPIDSTSSASVSAIVGSSAATKVV